MATRKNRALNLTTISDSALHGIENYCIARAEWAACSKIADPDVRKSESAAWRNKMRVYTFDVLADQTEKSARIDMENRAAEKGKTLPVPTSQVMADAFAALVNGGSAEAVEKAYSALFARLGIEASGKGLTRACRFMATAGNATRYNRDKNDLVAASKVAANKFAMDALVKLLEHAGFQHDHTTGRITRPETMTVSE